MDLGRIWAPFGQAKPSQNRLGNAQSTFSGPGPSVSTVSGALGTHFGVLLASFVSNFLARFRSFFDFAWFLVFVNCFLAAWHGELH